MTPVYEQMKANGISLEIVFCSSDRTQEAFDQFTAQVGVRLLDFITNIESTF